MLAECLLAWVEGGDDIDQTAAAKVVAETILGFRHFLGMKKR